MHRSQRLHGRALLQVSLAGCGRLIPLAGLARRERDSLPGVVPVEIVAWATRPGWHGRAALAATVHDKGDQDAKHEDRDDNGCACER